MTVPRSTTPSPSEVIRRLFDLRFRDHHFALPAVVETYDADAQTVDATPQVMLYERQEDGTDVAKPVPLCTKCPVVFPGAGGFRLTFPIAKGDTVLLLFAESSIEQWLANGGQVDPQDDRRNHLSDGIALPGLHPGTATWSKASTSGATIGADGGPQIVFRSDMIELGGEDDDVPTDMVALASLVKKELSAIRDTVNKLVSTYNDHTHLLATGLVQTEGTAVKQANVAPITVPATTSTADPPASVGDVKSSVLKAK